MKIFRDSRDREWEVSVNVPDVERVKAGCGVDLYDLSQKGPIFTLGEDYALTLNVLWLLLKPQMEAHQVEGEEAFYNQLQGDDIENGARAIQDAMEEWLPLKKRTMFAKAVRLNRQLQEKAMEMFAQKIGATNLDQRLEGELQKRLDEAFEKLQETMSDGFTSSLQESQG